jgi:hypothetical protein
VTRARQRLPPGLDYLVERFKWSLRRPPADLELAPPVPGAAPRVLIAPTNFAGQGRAWAQALVRRGPGGAGNWAYRAQPGFGYQADYAPAITINAAPTAFQSAQFNRVVSRCQAVVMESGWPIFGRLFGYSAAREALALQTVGLDVAVLWHGSDIRLPSQHRATHRLSPYALPALKSRAAELESTARRNRRSMGHLGLPQLVSTPDLLDQVEDGRWCPVVVAPEVFALGSSGMVAPILAGGPPRVVHVPSDPLLKGTDLVDPILRRLAAQGRIEYLRAEGLPAVRVLELYASADVVADQFRMGIYGVAAAEAMALGRLVVSDVDRSVRALVQQLTGLVLPIEQAAAEDLEEVLERVIADPAPFRALAARGPAFAEAVHSGVRSANTLAAALGMDQAEG